MWLEEMARRWLPMAGVVGIGMIWGREIEPWRTTS